jgi:hypothetical protein
MVTINKAHYKVKEEEKNIRDKKQRKRERHI